MVRTKKIYREHLLDGAYKLAVDEGLQNFRARKIAKVMNCSTQPIYREFKNMNELKAATHEYILTRVKNFFAPPSSNPTLDIQRAIFSFAQKEPKAFQRFFLADKECHVLLKNEVSTHFFKQTTQKFTEDMWYGLIGQATLVSFGHQIPLETQSAC